MQAFHPRETWFSEQVLQAYARAALPQTLSMRAVADTTEILLYDEISPRGVTAKDFVRVLAQAGDGPITLRINSPGGDVFAGMAIYNSLKARKSPVHVVVDGVAASAASFIAMAGDTIQMNEASMLMVHRAFGLAIGNAQELTETAAVLEKIDAQMADIYASRTGKPAAEMMEVMRAETWFTSSEAVAQGWATGIVAAPQSEQRERATFAKAEQAKRIVTALRAALPDYDPDGDGDNDAQEALTLITAAMDMLGDAAAALNGADEDADESDMVIIASAEDPTQFIKVKRPAAIAFQEPDIAANDNENGPVMVFAVAPEQVGQTASSPANDNSSEAEAAKAVAHAARLRRLQLARIDVV